MREITLKRIPYADLDYDGFKTGTNYFSFLDLFYGSQNSSVMRSINKSLNPDYIGTDSLRKGLNDYFNGDGRTAFSILWSIPSLPYLTNLPTENHPEYADKRNNIIENFPKQIDDTFNQKLSQIDKKKIYKNSSLHPSLKDYNTPGSNYILPDVIEVNPDYPPFYNKYLDAKKKAGLP